MSRRVDGENYHAFEKAAQLIKELSRKAGERTRLACSFQRPAGNIGRRGMCSTRRRTRQPGRLCSPTAEAKRGRARLCPGGAEGRADEATITAKAAQRETAARVSRGENMPISRTDPFRPVSAFPFLFLDAALPSREVGQATNAMTSHRTPNLCRA